MIRQLKRSPLFVGLSEFEIQKVLDDSYCTVSYYKRNEMIALAGDPIFQIMIVVKGSVHTELIDDSGKVFRVDDIENLRLLAPSFLFGDNNRFPINVVSNTDTEILVIQKNYFVSLLNSNTVVLNNFLNILSNKSQFLVSKIKNTFMQSIEGKIANYILNVSKSLGSDNFEIPNSQTWMAEKFGVARPSVARVFSKMKSKGVIECKGRKISILDKARLERCIN
ncbi:MAG: Crp/Fnr family transcriptional regulator [Bacteroidetes bacterium]|nr:MAG: Crp/Fnr family transcriptional regulator [Bacteroidota bacterium]